MRQPGIADDDEHDDMVTHTIATVVPKPGDEGIHWVPDHGDPCGGGAVGGGEGEEVDMAVCHCRSSQAAGSVFFHLLLVFSQVSGYGAGVAGVVELVLVRT